VASTGGIDDDQEVRCRKNFERHFQESRHAFGMRALGLPNTKHFHEITKIEDAMACTCPHRVRSLIQHILTLLPTVAERLKREGRHEIFEQETMEELEDEEGNVYNRKTYDDLKKQGLI
jgi:splicing factor 3A subunit 3